MLFHFCGVRLSARGSTAVLQNLAGCRVLPDEGRFLMTADELRREIPVLRSVECNTQAHEEALTALESAGVA